jgi:predicted N-formylglutamate amidohydrolase
MRRRIVFVATDEPPPFTVDNENGTSPLLIVADHAGKHFPRRLGQLCLSNAECERHIAWDIGAVCCLIGKALNAVVVRQNYSRLVIDCNRTPGSGTSVLDLSELTRVPGNIGLSGRPPDSPDFRAQLQQAGCRRKLVWRRHPRAAREAYARMP